MKILSAVCIILGCFLGAGFVSGREVASYFSRFGGISYFSCIVCGILFFVLTMFFFSISNRVKSSSEFVSVYFKKYSTLAEWLFAVCIVILIGSMIAGTSSLAGSLGYNKLIFVSLTIVLTFLVVNKNVKGISNINLVLVPILILVLCITISSGDNDIVGYENGIGAIFSGTAYVFINIVSLGLLIIEIGANYSRKEKLIISILSTIVIIGLLLGINHSIITNDLVNDIMPNLTLSQRNMALYVVMQISIYLGLFTTLISNVFLLSKFIEKYTKNLTMSIILSLMIGWLISLFGFDNIVGFVYIFIAIIGFGMVIGSRKGVVVFK